MTQLAVYGAVAAIAGETSGHLGLQPRSLSASERQDLEIPSTGYALEFQVGGGNVFLHSDGVCTTIWFGGPESVRGADILEAALLRSYPAAVRVRDGRHGSDSILNLRTFEVRLSNDHLAVVDAVYPRRLTSEPRFMTRITAMARQN